MYEFHKHQTRAGNRSCNLPERVCCSTERRAGEHICHAMSTVRLVSLLRARLWSFQPVPFRIHSRGPVISTTSALYTLHSPLNCWSGPGLLHVQMPRAASRSQGPLCTLSRPHPVSRLQTLQKAHCPSCLCPDSVPGLGKVTCD